MANCIPTYPEAYHRILLALDANGKPLVVPFETEGDAERERLRFYNFLKWCRRAKNLQAVVHLEGRYNQVGLQRKGNEIHFRLNTVTRFHQTEHAIDKALAAAGLEVALPREQPRQRPVLPGETPPTLEGGFGLPFQPDADLNNEIFRRLEAAQNEPQLAQIQKPQNLEDDWFGEQK